MLVMVEETERNGRLGCMATSNRVCFFAFADRNGNPLRMFKFCQSRSLSQSRAKKS